MNLNAFAKKHGGSRIWEVESVESYLGSEDVHNVMCMDAHCWSPRGEKKQDVSPAWGFPERIDVLPRSQRRIRRLGTRYPGRLLAPEAHVREKMQ